MRTIKFRGIKKRGDDWTYGGLVKEACGDVWIFPEGDTYCNAGGDFYSENEPGIRMVKPETVGQFTGLTDVNGKEIYEGDIIVQHGDDMPGIRGAVVYDEANARFGMAYTNYWESGSVTHFDTLERVKCYSDRNRKLTYEVIGNIHDNPELLETNN